MDVPLSERELRSFALRNRYYFVFFQKAEAQLAYELQAAKIQQKIRNEEIQIQVCSRYQIINQFELQIILLTYTILLIRHHIFRKINNLLEAQEHLWILFRIEHC